MSTQDEEKKLCDNCHERPATSHICNAGDEHNHKDRSYCRPCVTEYMHFLGEKLPGFGTGSMSPDQIEKMRTSDIAAIFAEAEAHLKKWLIDRNSH